jgi:adenylate cyclase
MIKALTPAWIKPRLYHLLSPIVALALVGVINHYTNLVKLFEYQTVNIRFRVRSSFDPPADPRLVFVGIDEPSLLHLGRWPWPRHVEANFVDTIVASGINLHTLTFDLMFTEDSNKLQENSPGALDDDAALGKSVAQLASVITGALSFSEPLDAGARTDAEKRTQDKLAQPGPTVPLPNVKGDIQQMVGSNVADLPVLPIRSQSLFGFVNDDPSIVDGVRHTIPLVVRVRDKVYPSLALQTLCQMLGVDPDKVDVDLSAGQVRLTDLSGETRRIPVNSRGEFTINYRREKSFQSAGFFWLMRELYQHAKDGGPLPPQCDITNKTLLVGESATALGDMGPSPLAAITPLPYAHLNVINNVLKGDYLTFVPWWWVVIGWLLATWATLVRLKEAPLGEAVAVPLGLMFAYVVTAFAIFWVWSIEIALFWPVTTYVVLNFGGIVLRWREEKRGREQIKQLFSRMISPEIMNHLLDHPENIKLGGSDRSATVLFSDIRDYTKFSEGKEADEVVRQLNVYFERMVPCVTECKGTFHKFIGDAIMAAWGDIAPLSSGPAKDAQNAVKSALMMRQRLILLNEERVAEKLIPLRIGIGLNNGMVQAGMLGSSGRMEFTVMGDGVNIASRLEGLTKEFKTDLAISDTVKQLIGDDFLVRRLGLIVLKGKSEATVVYEVLAEKSDLEQSRMSPGGVERYEKAFDDFLARRFAKAEAGFIACAKDYPDDHCVKTYLAASREFILAPPPPDWDGRIVMTTK